MRVRVRSLTLTLPLSPIPTPIPTPTTTPNPTSTPNPTPNRVQVEVINHGMDERVVDCDRYGRFACSNEVRQIPKDIRILTLTLT